MGNIPIPMPKRLYARYAGEKHELARLVCREVDEVQFADETEYVQKAIAHDLAEAVRVMIPHFEDNHADEDGFLSQRIIDDASRFSAALAAYKEATDADG